MKTFDDIQAGIIAILMDILQLEKHEIEVNTVFKDYGMDSISGLEFVREINNIFDINLDAADLYDYATIDKISHYVFDKYNEDVLIMQEVAGSAGNNNDSNNGTGAKVTEDVDTDRSAADSQQIEQSTKENVQNHIILILMDILQLEQEEIEVNTVFKDYGMDSISGLEFIREINNQFGLNLDAADLYDYATINQITAYVCEKLNENEQALKTAGIVEKNTNSVQDLPQTTSQNPSQDNSNEVLELLSRLENDDADVDEINKMLEEIYE